tara:strand:- start:417 stop:758 length:342 start_codon:yes stop_codon:yes gene_type:complete
MMPLQLSAVFDSPSAGACGYQKFDVFEDRCASRLFRLVRLATHPLELEHRKHTFGNGVIPSIAFPRPAQDHVVISESSPIPRGNTGSALIGVVNKARDTLSLLDRHIQRLGHE